MSVYLIIGEFDDYSVGIDDDVTYATFIGHPISEVHSYEVI